MTDDIFIRPYGTNGLALFRNEIVLLFGLSNEDAAAFAGERDKYSGAAIISHADHATSTSRQALHLDPEGAAVVRRRPGRRLVLREHAGLIIEMVNRNPGMTARDVERALKDRGIKFSTVTAVTNFARRYNLQLAA